MHRITYTRQQIEKSIAYWKNALRSYQNNVSLHESSDSEKSSKSPNDAHRLMKMIKKMRPGAVMQFVSKQLGMHPAEFLNQNACLLALKAVQNGWTKTKDIAKSIKDFSSKNKEDATGIDWDNVSIDEDTMKFRCLFAGDAGKKLKQFAKHLQEKMIEFAKEEHRDSVEESEQLNEVTLTDDTPIEELMKYVKVDGNSISGFSSGIYLASIMNSLKIEDKKEFIESLGGWRVAAHILKQFMIANHSKGIDKAVSMLLNTFKDNEYKKLIYSEFVAKMFPEAEEALKNHGIIVTGYLGGLISDEEIDRLIDNPANKKVAKEVADSIKDKADEIVNNYHYDGPDRGIDFDDLREKLGMSSKKFYGILGGDSSLRSLRLEELESDLKTFLMSYDNDPDTAVRTLLGTEKGVKADMIAELAAKLKPESAKTFKDFGINIDGKVGGLANKASEVINHVDHLSGFSASQALTDARKSLGMSYDEFEKLFSKSTNSAAIRTAYAKVEQNIEHFVSMYDKDPEAAVKSIVRTHAITPQKEAMAEILCKIKPDAAKYFEEHGYTINGKVDGIGVNVNAINKAADAAKTPKEAVDAAGSAKEPAKELANDKQAKEEMAKKAGIKAFTLLGWARLAAKTAGYVLNHGKTLIDAMGASKIKKQEDQNNIAEMRFIVDNGESSDSNYSDTQFSIRYNVNDLEWHATCLDDRKMKFPEEKLIEKALSTENGKKFKKYCLQTWKSLFELDSEEECSMLPFILNNIDKFGLNDDDREFFKSIEHVANRFEVIKTEFGK